MKNQKIYNIWKQIKTRCFNKNNHGYKDYGARGITIDTNWINDFSSFQQYVTGLPNFSEDNIGRNGITLDRYENNGNYEKGNLRWVPMEIQCRNRRKKTGNVKSKYVGVSYDPGGVSNPRKKKWRARITINKKTKVLGRFETEKQASESRNDYIKINKLEGFIIN
jgi:hypothetical protein